MRPPFLRLIAAVGLLLAPCAHAQVNQWVTVKPAFQAPASSPSAVLNGYNGWACVRYDARDSSILAWRMITDARRKGGIYANGLVRWSLRKNSIETLTLSNYGGGTYEPNPSFHLLPEFAADTTPCPRHPYDAMAIVDSLQAVYMLLGATPRIDNFEGNPDPALNAAHDLDMASTWKFTYADKRWHRIASSIRQFWPDYYCENCVPFHDNHLVHWPAGRRLVFIEARGRNIAEFDLASETWAKVTATGPAPFNLSWALTTWDSKRNLIVFRNHHRVCAYDPAARSWAALPDCGVDLDSASERYTDITYIPKHDVYLVVGGDGTTRVFEIGAGRWVTVADGGPGRAGGYLQYDPATDKVGMSLGREADMGGFLTLQYVPGGLGIRRDLGLLSSGTLRPASPALYGLDGRWLPPALSGTRLRAAVWTVFSAP